MDPCAPARQRPGSERWRSPESNTGGGDILERLAARPSPRSSPGQPVGRRDALPQANFLPETALLGMITELAADRLDLVVSAIRPPHQKLFAIPLVDEEFLLVGPPSMARTGDDDRLRTAPADALAPLPLVTYGEELPILRRYWRNEFGHRPANTVALAGPRPACGPGSRRSERRDLRATALRGRTRPGRKPHHPAPPPRGASAQQHLPRGTPRRADQPGPHRRVRAAP